MRTTSRLDFEEAHDRTYHAYHPSTYLKPNDEDEIQRVSKAYYAVKLKMNKRNYYAPVVNPTKILDIGTGSGLWCVDVAKEHPRCEVTGTDLSPVQLSHPNCQFYVENANHTWRERGEFDLIHIGDLHSHTTIRWPRCIGQAYQNLKSGGYLELHGLGRCASHTGDDVNSYIKELEDDCQRAMQRLGGTAFCDSEKVKEQMYEAGFVDVQVVTVKLYAGARSDHDMSGALWKEQMIVGLTSDHAKCLLDISGYQPFKYQVLLMECRKYLNQASGYLYTPLHIVYGQKPPSH